MNATIQASSATWRACLPPASVSGSVRVHLPPPGGVPRPRRDYRRPLPAKAPKTAPLKPLRYTRHTYIVSTGHPKTPCSAAFRGGKGRLSVKRAASQQQGPIRLRRHRGLVSNRAFSVANSSAESAAICRATTTFRVAPPAATTVVDGTTGKGQDRNPRIAAASHSTAVSASYRNDRLWLAQVGRDAHQMHAYAKPLREHDVRPDILVPRDQNGAGHRLAAREVGHVGDDQRVYPLLFASRSDRPERDLDVRAIGERPLLRAQAPLAGARYVGPRVPGCGQASISTRRRKARKIEVAESRSLVHASASPPTDPRPTEAARPLPRQPKPHPARSSRRIAVPGAASGRGGRGTLYDPEHPRLSAPC